LIGLNYRVICGFQKAMYVTMNKTTASEKKMLVFVADMKNIAPAQSSPPVNPHYTDI